VTWRLDLSGQRDRAVLGREKQMQMQMNRLTTDMGIAIRFHGETDYQRKQLQASYLQGKFPLGEEKKKKKFPEKVKAKSWGRSRGGSIQDGEADPSHIAQSQVGSKGCILCTGSCLLSLFGICFQDLGGASQEVLRYLRNHSLAEAQLISSAEVAQD
jgi:hypothetical protein